MDWWRKFPRISENFRKKCTKLKNQKPFISIQLDLGGKKIRGWRNCLERKKLKGLGLFGLKMLGSSGL